MSPRSLANIKPADSTTKLTRAEAQAQAKQISTDLAAISDGMKILINGGLRMSTLVLLVSNASGVSQRNVQKVLSSLPELKQTYCK